MIQEINYQSLSSFEKFQIDFLRESFKDTINNGTLVSEKVFDRYVDYLLDTEAICRVSGWRTITDEGEMEIEFHLMKLGYHDPSEPTNLGESNLVEPDLNDWWRNAS